MMIRMTTLLLVLSTLLFGCNRPIDETPAVPEGVLRQQATKNLNLNVQSMNGEQVVALAPILHAYDYRFRWTDDRSAIEFGHTDPIYTLQLGSDTLEQDGQLFVPVSKLDRLFASDFTVHPNNSKQTIELKPIAQDGLQAQSIGGTTIMPTPGTPSTLPDVDLDALLTKATTYVGTPYVFGSAPYPQSGTFDCSSFVQYVYGQYGVKLKRSSRQQATQGQRITKSQLMKGDLIFFSVPGRFASNQTVGHVAIYMGNDQIIHTVSPQRGGVYVAKFSGTTWERRFLLARRVAM